MEKAFAKTLEHEMTSEKMLKVLNQMVATIQACMKLPAHAKPNAYCRGQVGQVSHTVRIISRMRNLRLKSVAYQLSLSNYNHYKKQHKASHKLCKTHSTKIHNYLHKACKWVNQAIASIAEGNNQL